MFIRYDLNMRALFEFIVHLLITVFTLLKPGGVKAIASENLMLRQQLIVVQRTRKRAPNLKTSDRFIFGLLSFLINPDRLRKIAIIVKTDTFLKLHQALVKRKYRRKRSTNHVYKDLAISRTLSASSFQGSNFS